MESRFPHASWSSCNESASGYSVEQNSVKIPDQCQIEINMQAETGAYDRWKKEDSCLQHLHLQVQMTQQKKTECVGFDWPPFHLCR